VGLVEQFPAAIEIQKDNVHLVFARQAVWDEYVLYLYVRSVWRQVSGLEVRERTRPTPYLHCVEQRAGRQVDVSRSGPLWSLPRAPGCHIDRDFGVTPCGLIRPGTMLLLDERCLRDPGFC